MTTRSRILESWGLEASDWWLPNDEGCPRIVRSIKDFIRERETAPKDQVSEDLKEMSQTPIEGVLGAPSSLDETGFYTGGSPDQDWSYEGKIPGAAAQYPAQ